MQFTIFNLIFPSDHGNPSGFICQAYMPLVSGVSAMISTKWQRRH